MRRPDKGISLLVRDVVIIGAGLFGQIIAARLRALAMDVVVLDCGETRAASRAAGCVIRPSWATRMSRAQVDQALELLDDLFGLTQIRFEIRPSGKALDLWHLDPHGVLSRPVVFCRAQRVSKMNTGWLVETAKGGYRTRHVIVAAGVWSEMFCPGLRQKGKWGYAWRCSPIEPAFIQLWAPYRQIVGFTMSDRRGWIGDGTAFKQPLESHEEKAWERCSKATGLSDLSMLLGVRPYAATSLPCYLEERDGLTIATGGAKNGTLAAAWAATEIAKRLV